MIKPIKCTRSRKYCAALPAVTKENKCVLLIVNYKMIILTLFVQRKRVTTVLQFTNTILENLTDDANANLYLTTFSTTSLYLTKLFVNESFALVSLL